MDSRLVMAWAVSLLALGVVSGCGSSTKCGDGTVEREGECVPAATVCGANTTFDAETGRCVGMPGNPGGLTCAAGTVESESGDECIPDGTVICSAGTTFDMGTGTCLPDIAGCGEGTVLVAGRCVPLDDMVMSANPEGAEPNDHALSGSAPGAFTLPAVGMPAVTFDGCITPADTDGDGAVDRDRDSWLFTVAGPSTIEVQIDGRGGLAGASLVVGLDAELVDDGWARFGIDLTNASSTRTVFLPKAGQYALVAGDARAFVTGEPAGDAGTCYFMQVRQVATPAAMPLGADGAMGTYGAPQHYTMTAVEAQILFPSLTGSSEAVSPALVALAGGQYADSASGDPAEVGVFGLAAGEIVTLVVDTEFDFSMRPVEWELDRGSPAVMPLPAGPGLVTHPGDLFTFLHFTPTVGDVVGLTFDGGGAATFEVLLVGPDGLALSRPCPFEATCTSTEVWFPVRQEGAHYLAIFNEAGTEGVAYSITTTRTNVTPRAVTPGVGLPTALTTRSRDFFRVDTGDESWLRFGTSARLNVTNVRASLFDDTADGGLGIEVEPVREVTLAGDAGFEQVVADLDETFLVMVENADGHVGTESFSFDVTRVLFNDLGTVTAAAPFGPMTYTIPGPGTPARFLVRAAELSTLTVTATPSPTVNPRLISLDDVGGVVQTVDVAPVGVAEMLVERLGAGVGFLAFTVDQTIGVEGTAMVGVTAMDPPYMVAPDAAATYTDACTAGMVVFDGSADDEVAMARGFFLAGFTYFGVSSSVLVISSNGWMTFDATYAGDSLFTPDPIPTADTPNALVAPYWDDIVDVRVCMLAAADRVTVQWEGTLFDVFDVGPRAQFQAILHPDGRIQFVYGPDHELDGSEASIGIENQTGTIGISYSDGVSAGTGLTFTPM